MQKDDKQSWQIQQIEEAILLADRESAVWVESQAVDAWIDSWKTDD